MESIISTGDNELEDVNVITYLRSTISSDLILDTEIQTMIVKAAITFTRLIRRMWKKTFSLYNKHTSIRGRVMNDIYQAGEVTENFSLEVYSPDSGYIGKVSNTEGFSLAGKKRRKLYSFCSESAGSNGCVMFVVLKMPD